MFDSTSRYYFVEDATINGEDGQEIIYKKRRFIPDKKNKFQSREIVGKDRLDLVAHEVLGDPRQYWRICDVNEKMHPLELLLVPGEKIKIPLTDEVEI